MASTDETKLFLRYRATGDAEALAMVFDRVAPNLLLVAAHLSRDHAIAEDLVQTTFVAAMENADRFRSDQPLLPWLNGILLNRWRQERRKLENRRRHSSELEAGDLQTGDDSSPHSEAESAELMVVVTEALEQLPQSYRSALNLRLVHGLQAVQIAHTLGLSPGTVRSQLKRGLELLRRYLPQSLVLPSVLALLSGRGLAAMRARVLRMVPDNALASVGTGSGTGAIWLMKKWMVGVVLALFLVGGVVWTREAWPHVAAGVESAPDDVTANARLAKGTGSTAASMDESQLADRRQKLPAAVGHDVLLRVVGRCVDGDTGAALPGVHAQLERKLAPGEWDIGEAWRDPEAVPCDADGRFEIELPRAHAAARGRYGLTLAAQPRRVQESGFDNLRFGSSDRIDVGDVMMFRTVLLVGRITDNTGRPLSRMRMLFHRVQLNPRSTQQRPSAIADEDGRFKVHLERGSWSMDTATTSGSSGSFGYGNEVTPEAIDLTGPADTVEVVLVSDPMDASHRIAGRVVDMSGQPVAGVEIRFYGLRKWHTMAYARTDVTGTFTAYVWKEWGKPESSGVRAQVRRGPWGSEEFAPLQNPDAYYRWGSDDVRIVVERSPARRVPIVLRVAGEDTVVEEYGIAVGKTHLPRTRPSTHEGGEGVVIAPHDGPHHFRVYPDDPHLLPSVVLPIPDSRTATPITVHVYRRRDMTVRVIDAAGSPVAGTRLRLIQPNAHGNSQTGDHDPGNRASSAELDTAILRGRVSREERVAAGHSTISRLGQVVSEDRTNAEGIAHLPGPAGAADLILAALGPGHTPTVIRHLAIPTDSKIVKVVVQRGATIHGTIRPRRLLEELRGPRHTRRPARLRNAKGFLPGLVFERNNDNAEHWPPGISSFGRIAISADGSFVARGVPPGTWDVHLKYESAALHRFARPLIGTAHKSLGGRRPLAVLTDLRDGEVRRLDLDVSDRMPAKLEGRVLSNGQPVRYESIFFFRLEGKELGEGLNPTTTTDGNGRFVMPHLPPGEYAIWRKLRGVWQAKPWYLSRAPFDEHIQLTAGRGTTQDFHSKLGSLLVCFKNLDGTPFANTYVKLILNLRTRWGEDERTDAQGVVRFPRFPCGEIELKVERGNYRLVPSRIQLRGTGDWENFDVVVHNAKKLK